MRLQTLVEYDIWKDVPKTTGQMVPLDQILSNLHPADRRFMAGLEAEKSEQAYLSNLQRSIERTGIKQPIDVQSLSKGYHIPEGNHRLIVAKRLGLEQVPVNFIQTPES